jgi:hypothetical protein
LNWPGLTHHKTAAVIIDPEVKPPPNLLNIDSDDGRVAVLDDIGDRLLEEEIEVTAEVDQESIDPSCGALNWSVTSSAPDPLGWTGRSASPA